MSEKLIRIMSVLSGFGVALWAVNVYNEPNSWTISWLIFTILLSIYWITKR